MTIGIAAPNPSGIPGFNSHWSLTAGVGGGAVNAVPLRGWTNVINYVLNANDSVSLPPAYWGAQITVINRAPNILMVFGNVNPFGVQDVIADATGNPSTAGVPVPANSGVVLFICNHPQHGFTNMWLPGRWERRTLAA